MNYKSTSSNPTNKVKEDPMRSQLK